MSDGCSVAGYPTQSFAKNDFQLLVAEMREQNFDSIRFATYRAASKLRFVQKKVNLHLVDIWNIIESFRENGLNAVESNTEVKISRIELLLSTVYHNLNKRLPVAQQIDADKSIGMLLSFLFGTYDRDNIGRLRVFSIKIALATLCAGKLLDKLRYVFSQISDTSGRMDHGKLVDYLREVLALVTAVFEGPTFGFTDSTAGQCFESNSRVTVNQFLDTLMNDPCPASLMWLPLLHRMASVEHVYHPVLCDACGVDSFRGFRYKCQRCTNYQICQNCFWRGRTSGTHSNQHEMKEYSSYKSPSKQLGHSIHKSLRCKPTHTMASHPLFPDHPDRPLDLANVVPITPSLSHSAATAPLSDTNSVYFNDDWAFDKENGQFAFVDFANMDDEHKLIARYSAKLSGRTTYPPYRHLESTSVGEDGLGQRTMIARLEQQNKDIVRDIAQLRAMQTATADVPPYLSESGLTADLDTLRSRKLELEARMRRMQSTRRDLTGQLEYLMKMLRQQPPGQPPPPLDLTALEDKAPVFVREPTTPVASLLENVPTTTMSLTRTGSFPAGAAPKSGTLQGDLLCAADDITKNMSTLVKELDRAEAEDEQAQQQQQQQQQMNGLFVNGAQ